MAVYAAVTPLIRYFSLVLNNLDVVLPPRGLKASRFANKELKSFRDFVERLDSRSRKRMNASLERMAETTRACGVEEIDVINEAEFEYVITLTHLLLELFLIVKEEYYTLLPELDEGIASSSSVVSKSKMVELRDKWRLLKDTLIAPRVESFFTLLVGMTGIGKTALAQEIFEDLDILVWFSCCAWVTVGTEWKSEEITEAILVQVAPEVHKVIMGGPKEEISEGLKESLKGKRYLIVLDDVWNFNVHEYLKSSLPDNENGCRVLLTSRMKYIGINSTNPVCRMSMRLLNEEESWDLLREKVFVGDSCPPHLEEAGKKIAERCDGLPLTILIIAGFLSKAEKSTWIDAAVKRKHQFFINAYDQISKVLYPSYNVLFDELKVSFLYMGAFLLKYEIPKSRLINLWIVEDFVELYKGTLEYSAKFYLEHFESSSLIVCQRDITSYFGVMCGGHVKSCRLHSSWWHFCQIEARKTNLFHVLDCYNKDDLEEALKGHNRLSIHNNVLFALKHVYNSIEKVCAFTVQTLLCFGPYCQCMVPVCFGLKFLRRLNALNIRFYDFPLEVLKLVKLRPQQDQLQQRLLVSIADCVLLQVGQEVKPTYVQGKCIS